MSISKTIQLIKGEAAYWANKENLFNSKLSWANEYFAVSVSESMVHTVREYIRNQEEHQSGEDLRRRVQRVYDEVRIFQILPNLRAKSGLKPLKGFTPVPSLKAGVTA